MLPQSKARIFLSAQRSEIQTEKYRSYASFNQNSATRGFGKILLFDEVTLAAEESCSIESEPGQTFVIIPLVGTIHFENEEDNNLVNPGQALFISTNTNISNPYSEGLVNYLQIGFSDSGKIVPTSITCFDIDSNKNKLIDIGTVSDCLPAIKLGKFDGRAEFLCRLYAEKNGAFVHVIAGAFEVQYRLLEAKDSLTVWDAEALDIEALSNEAILLVIETVLPDVYE